MQIAENTRGQWAVGSSGHMVNMNSSRNGNKNRNRDSNTTRETNISNSHRKKHPTDENWKLVFELGLVHTRAIFFLMFMNGLHIRYLLYARLSQQLRI